MMSVNKPEYKTRQQKQRFYKSKPWRELRLEILERDNHECQECKRRGKVTVNRPEEQLKEGRRKQILNVHHIKEIYYHPELALEPDNLETVCINCHNIEHDRTLDKVRPNTNPKKEWGDERW